MNPLMIPIHRPVAVSMFFTAVVLLGGIAWQRLPVQLLPVLQGGNLQVMFNRPGSDPEVVEREILMPLEARVRTLSQISETFGEIRGSGGRFRVRLERGADIKVRQLELQRIVSDLQHEQPVGTWMDVRSASTESFSSFVMMIHVTGPSEDENALHDLVEQLIAPRFVAVPGISQALVTGGAARQVTVTVDPARAVGLGVTTASVIRAVEQNVGRLRYVGKLEDESGLTAVLLDGRLPDVDALGAVRIQRDRPALLRHVSEVAEGFGLKEQVFRVNGQPAVGLVLYQEQDANLVRLGHALRARVEAVRRELQTQGLDLVIGFDAAESVEEQIDRLGLLGTTGFAVALLVLLFFLREWRAVAVIAVAVPVSLLAALSLLYLSGQSLNLVSLFGLALAIGLVVDNSVVVFEAVQRHLERGLPVEFAVAKGLRRTIRAIVASSATTAVVFLPVLLVDFEDEMLRELSKVITLSILLPLAASLLVAVVLVPLLAHRFAAPAAQRRLADLRRRRAERAGLVAPDPVRMVFTAVVSGALRHPPAWISGTGAAILITAFIALPWVGVNSSAREAPEADTVRLSVRLPAARGSVERASDAIAPLEQMLLDLPGVDRVEVLVNEEGGALTVQLVDAEQRPPGFRASTVRELVRTRAQKIKGLEILSPGQEQRDASKAPGEGGGNPFEGNAAEIVISGPDTSLLESLARTVELQLESMPFIPQAWTTSRPGLQEYWLEPERAMLESLGITFDQVLPELRIAGREGQRIQPGFVTRNGRELPLIVERAGARSEDSATRSLRAMRLQTEAGVVPVTSLASMRLMPASPVIAHHNGRRELAVRYRLRGDLPETGPTRIALEEQIAEAVRGIPRPAGVTIETMSENESTSILQQILVPAVLLLFLILAMTFESLSLPVLILLSLPLTLLGATWALAVAGMALNQMAVLGALTLVGLTVNPGILIVDRMQQFIHAGWTSGAAALGAVRERTRPVLMTTTTTVAGLWPLSISTGRENEIWPPFATIVIGGLITSGLLTLLIVPVGFILLRRIDDLFARVGPWLVLAWAGATFATMAALILTETVTSLLWQTTLGFLLGGFLLALVVLLFRDREIPEPDCAAGPPRLDIRHLHKVYGLPGAVRSALLAPTVFASRVLARGGRPFHRNDAVDRLIPWLLAGAGFGYLSYAVQSLFWTLAFAVVSATLLSRLLVDIRRARGLADDIGAVQPGGIEGGLALVLPWLALALATWQTAVEPLLAGATRPRVLFLPVIAFGSLLVFQAMRMTARRAPRRTGDPGTNSRTRRRLQRWWWRWSDRVGGLDLPLVQVRALGGVSFTVDRGMVGILGPNGAGKTTLLRQVAGILEPTRGAIHLGRVPLVRIRRYLARWIGYLPQDAGLPGSMSAREYLVWYAGLYDLPAEDRAERVEGLLSDVGLGEAADKKISALSGGMRQRVAVARTLLRLPPVIVVDEPTVGLDPRERIRFRNLLSRLALDRIVLFSTHVVEDVAVSCDRVLVLADGRLLFDGPPERLALEATGRVWELRTPADRSPDLPAGAIHTAEQPAPDGSIIHRILAAEMPSGTTRPLDATVEDGYMWLTSRSAATSLAETTA